MTALPLVVTEETIIDGENNGDVGNSGDGGNSGDRGSSGDRGNSGDGNSSEGSGSGHYSQNGDGDDDDEEEEPEHSGLGACSLPSSQKGDASTEDQTSQAEELPVKNTGKTGTPAIQPPATGASKRKVKKPVASIQDSSRPRHNIPALA